LNAFYAFVSKYFYLWGGILIALGIFINFFGRKLAKPTIFIIATLLVTLVLALLVYSFIMTGDPAAWLQWTLLALCLVAGLFVGFILTRENFIKFGMGVIGGGACFAVALLLCTIFQCSRVWLFWLIIGLATAVGFILSFRFSDVVMIISTCLIGSYGIVRGASLYIGGYPNEFDMAKKLANKIPVPLPWSFWLYIGFMVLFFILGGWAQGNQMKKEGAGYKHPFHYL